MFKSFLECKSGGVFYALIYFIEDLTNKRRHIMVNVLMLFLMNITSA